MLLTRLHCKNNVWILHEGPTDFTNDESEQNFSLNFTKSGTKFCKTICFSKKNKKIVNSEVRKI